MIQFFVFWRLFKNDNLENPQTKLLIWNILMICVLYFIVQALALQLLPNFPEVERLRVQQFTTYIGATAILSVLVASYAYIVRYYAPDFTVKKDCGSWLGCGD